jgi:hypothetical protein
MTLLLSCSVRQNKSENDIQQEGRIKLITSYGFKGNQTVNDTIASKATYRYDEEGKLIEVNYHD